MMSEPFVLVEEHGDGLTIVRLNRPPLNPLSQAMLGEITRVAGALGADAAVKAVVVAGSDRALAAGADIEEFGGPDDAERIEAGFRAAFDTLAAIPRPVIAAIRGFALGGGLELALACDLRVAADSARLGQPEILLGIIPGAGGTQRLPRLVGPARAKELVWSGRQVRADEALAIGLVNEVVEPEGLMERAMEVASAIAEKSPVALQAAKEAVKTAARANLREGLEREIDLFALCLDSEDKEEGVRDFMEKRKPDFKGR